MSLLTWLSGYDAENAARGDAAGAALQQLNTDARARGRYDDATWAQIQRDYETEFDTDPDTINTAFDEGWSEGSSNVSSWIKGTLNRIVADPLRAVIAGLPWWLWGIGLAVAAFYLWPIIRRLLR